MTIRYWLSALALCFVLPGCTAQLNSNTLDMQASYKDLLVKQILYNVGQAIDDQTKFLPSQFLILAGSASTTSGVTPGFSLPLPGVTATNTLTTAPFLPQPLAS